MSFGKIGLTTFLAFFLLSVNAQTNKPELIINNFFKLHEDRGARKAVEYLYSTNEWYQEEVVEQVLAKVSLYTSPKKTGNYYGRELIAAKKLGDSYRYYSYMVKYESQPWRYEFVLYKSKDKWKMITFSIDIDFRKELGESENLYSPN